MTAGGPKRVATDIISGGPMRARGKREYDRYTLHKMVEEILDAIEDDPNMQGSVKFRVEAATWVGIVGTEKP